MAKKPPQTLGIRHRMALRITNYFVHPVDNRYMVFVFRQKLYADYFEELLKKENITFERHFEEQDREILFGVHKRFQRKALNANFLTHAKFRKPFISNRLVKYSLLIITFGMIALAIVGYIRTR